MVGHRSFHGNNGDIFDFLFIWPKFAVVVGIVLLLGSDCLLRRTVDVEPAGVMTRAIARIPSVRTGTISARKPEHMPVVATSTPRSDAARYATSATLKS